jgi:hypothetical protein
MSLARRMGLVALVMACCPWSTGQAGVYVGVRVGGPYYRPYYGCRGYGYGYGYGYYRPYPLFVGVGVPPVIVQPGPVVVQQPAIVQPAYPPPGYPSSSYPPPAQPPAPLPPPTPTTAAAPQAPDLMPAVATSPGDFQTYLQQLQSGDEQTRSDALIRLGRLKAERAVGPMVKALNSDTSVKVREAAARGLGLIGAPSALAALQYAAQSDDDREVRRSASFAAEVIRGNLRR